MTTCSRSTAWERVRCLEDLMALVDQCQDHARVLYKQGWHEGSWDAVYDEAVALRRKLDTLHHELADTWPILHIAATAPKEE